MNKISCIISSPKEVKDLKLKKEDVWNKMIVAETDEICPIFKDKVPYKSVTVICNLKNKQQVIYWLEYVHGVDCVSNEKIIDEDKIAIRSDYQCW